MRIISYTIIAVCLLVIVDHLLASELTLGMFIFWGGLGTALLFWDMRLWGKKPVKKATQKSS